MTPRRASRGGVASGRFSRLLTALLVLALVLPMEQIGRIAGELISAVVPAASGVGDLPQRRVESRGGAVAGRPSIIDRSDSRLPVYAPERIDEGAAVDGVTRNAARLRAPAGS